MEGYRSRKMLSQTCPFFGQPVSSAAAKAGATESSRFTCVSAVERVVPDFPEETQCAPSDGAITMM